MVYGRSGIGKSLMVSAWALCLAHGLPWYGRATRKMKVLNVLTEGWDKKRRLAAWKNQFKVKQISRNYVWEDTAVNLYTGYNLDDWIEAVERKQADPKHIFFDTLNSCSYGADEISGKDVGRILERAKLLMSHFKCGVTFVHHPPKYRDNLRGHSSLFNDVDIVLQLQGNSQQPDLILRCEKNKGGKEFEIFLKREIVETKYGTTAIITAKGETADLQDIRPVKDTELACIEEILEEHGALSVPQIAELTGKSIKTVYRYLATLKQQGVVGQKQKATYSLTTGRQTREI